MVQRRWVQFFPDPADLVEQPALEHQDDYEDYHSRPDRHCRRRDGEEGAHEHHFEGDEFHSQLGRPLLAFLHSCHLTLINHATAEVLQAALGHAPALDSRAGHRYNAMRFPLRRPVGA